MATGVEQEVICSLVNAGTLTLENTAFGPFYTGIVVSMNMIMIIDWGPRKVRLHRLLDGKLLASTGILESRPSAVCLLNDAEIGVILRNGLIQILPIECTNKTGIITPNRTLRVNGGLDQYHGIVKYNENLLACGRIQDMMYWCIVSLNDGHVDSIHLICKGNRWTYVTTQNNMIYISCNGGRGSPNTGVYGYDILNTSQCRYTYKHQELMWPTVITIDKYGFIFVCNHLDPFDCIHLLTDKCQPVSIFTQGIPSQLEALFLDQPNGNIYVTSDASTTITRYRLEYQGSHKASDVKMSDERKQPLIEETSIEIGHENVDKGQSSEEMDTHPSVQSPMDYGDDKQGNLTEERICHLLSNESDLKDYISNDPPEACIKTLMSQASKLSSKESMKIILHFIVQEFTERFSDKHIRIWAGEEVIGPANVQTVLVCFYSGSCDMSVESFYDLKVIYRDYNTADGESAAARALELDKKIDLTIEHCDLVNEAITLHGEDLFTKHSNLEAISSGGILSSKSRGLVQETCIILYCRVKGIIPFGETPFPKRLKVNEKVSIAVDVREGYFSSHADSQNNDQENTLRQERKKLKEPLRMGCSIGPAGRCESGTVGPFVKINSDRIGFLTCAHVVFSDSELLNLPNMTQADPIVREIVQPPDGDQSASQYYHRLCGRVFSAMFRGDWSPSSAEKFGIDAAVIEITSRFPNAGVFVPIEESQLEDAGFSLNQPPKFDTGEIMPHPINRKIQRAVIKVGSETGLTRGLLWLTKGMVRYSISTGTLNRDNDRPEELKITMHGLMEISSASCNKNAFCTYGDSGSGVFLVVDDDDNNKLICIGLSFGVMSDGTGLAMPIDKILTALHRDDGLQIKLKDFENEEVV